MGKQIVHSGHGHQQQRMRHRLDLSLHETSKDFSLPSSFTPAGRSTRASQRAAVPQHNRSSPQLFPHDIATGPASPFPLRLSFSLSLSSRPAILPSGDGRECQLGMVRLFPAGAGRWFRCMSRTLLTDDRFAMTVRVAPFYYCTAATATGFSHARQTQLVKSCCLLACLCFSGGAGRGEGRCKCQQMLWDNEQLPEARR